MRQLITCIVAAALLSGCETLGLTALGIGGTVAVNHKMGSSPSRTFTAPLAKVRAASIWALKRMGIHAEGVQKTDHGELILASAGDRAIEVELEAITPSATRMKVVARRAGIFSYDGSTASEIIIQTEKGLGV